MASKNTVPRDNHEYRERWARLDKEARRRIVRSVNRVRPLEKRGEAAMAVGMARSQQRFWRRSWFVAPLLITALQLGQDIATVAVNLFVGVTLFGGMALFFVRRSRRAEQLNLDVVEHKRRR